MIIICLNIVFTGEKDRNAENIRCYKQILDILLETLGYANYEIILRYPWRDTLMWHSLATDGYEAAGASFGSSYQPLQCGHTIVQCLSKVPYILFTMIKPIA